MDIRYDVLVPFLHAEDGVGMCSPRGDGAQAACGGGDDLAHGVSDVDALVVGGPGEGTDGSGMGAEEVERGRRERGVCHLRFNGGYLGYGPAN